MKRIAVYLPDHVRVVDLDRAVARAAADLGLRPTRNGTTYMLRDRTRTEIGGDVRRLRIVPMDYRGPCRPNDDPPSAA